MNTDKDWARYGQVDPYFGVMTSGRYHSWVLTEQAKEEFFESGQHHVRRVMQVLREIDPTFSPSKAVDFGCGVGRVTLPLAREAATVLGVDVSPGMLSEAQHNAMAHGVKNVTFADSISGKFDLVHSFIVLQHIPPRRGEEVLADLLARLEPGGMLVVQVPYYWHSPMWRKLINRMTRLVPVTRPLVNLVKDMPFNYPAMTTFNYKIRSVLQILEQAGIREVRINLDSSAGPNHSSMTVYAQRPAMAAVNGSDGRRKGAADGQ
jgi:SAM-dependent methyltransferase